MMMVAESKWAGVEERQMNSWKSAREGTGGPEGGGVTAGTSSLRGRWQNARRGRRKAGTAYLCVRVEDSRYESVKNVGELHAPQVQAHTRTHSGTDWGRGKWARKGEMCGEVWRLW